MMEYETAEYGNYEKQNGFSVKSILNKYAKEGWRYVGSIDDHGILLLFERYNHAHRAPADTAGEN